MFYLGFFFNISYIIDNNKKKIYYLLTGVFIVFARTCNQNNRPNVGLS